MKESQRTVHKGFVSGGMMCKILSVDFQLNISNNIGFHTPKARPSQCRKLLAVIL